ncbi:MAG: DUF1353 domain-containing protein [Rhodobacteraceae bacterium]|uniref:M12 family metallopeptidase n=1 Tax=Amaricoccus sp. TaxID=1872485 RepID=UPI001D2C4EB4|nr:M12 family metallopeptidase [Amaricoccus sp.]MCB1373106.1 DUF1353 domain-containing protein [Paracoccaceae bacterium]HRW16931.1 M12 family metallopeptidase [Amaricoccus sp.]
MICNWTSHLTALAAVLAAPMALGQSFDISRGENEVRSFDAAENIETVDLLVEGQSWQISFVTDANGLAVYQGDIVLGDAEEIRSIAGSGQVSLQSLEQNDTGLFGLVARRQSTRWPDGRVPFAIDAGVPAEWRTRIRQAIRHWEEKTPIRFQELGSPSGTYVLFFDDPVTESCQSGVGRPMVGVRRIELANWCQWGNIVHEIGHALGMHHEQARSDRAFFVDVAFSANATDVDRAQFIADPNMFADLGPYCYDSMLHYPKTNRARTFMLTPKANPQGEWTGNPANMGQRRALAACDIATIRTIYGMDDPADLGDAPEGGFEGVLAFTPAGCETSRKCNLVNDLKFTDSRGIGWEATKRAAGAGPGVQSGTTDGASIPDWAQPLIGPPFDPSYIKPAVIHDHYTYAENRVRSWWATQRVFYDMLKDQGVSDGKARIMYMAVLLGSRKWVKLVPGESCGPNCIQDIGALPSMNRGPKDELYREWDETYDTPEFDAAMRLGMAALAMFGDEMMLEDMNVLAAELLPDQPVFQIGDSYSPNGLSDAVVAN